MTTIAVRGGVMCADSRAWAGDKRNIGTKTKLFRLGEQLGALSGAAIGISSAVVGNPLALRVAIERLARACPQDEWAGLGPITASIDAEALILTQESEVFHFKDGIAFSGPLECDFHAIGTGADFAIGAMRFGATAYEAVTIACSEDPWSKPPVLVMAADGREAIGADLAPPPNKRSTYFGPGELRRAQGGF